METGALSGVYPLRSACDIRCLRADSRAQLLFDGPGRRRGRTAQGADWTEAASRVERPALRQLGTDLCTDDSQVFGVDDVATMQEKPMGYGARDPDAVDGLRHVGDSLAVEPKSPAGWRGSLAVNTFPFQADC